MDELIALAHRKNAAWVTLVEARNRFYVPSSLAKSTADDRKIALDYATRTAQQAYDDLCDEYAVRMLMINHGEAE